MNSPRDIRFRIRNRDRMILSSAGDLNVHGKIQGIELEIRGRITTRNRIFSAGGMESVGDIMARRNIVSSGMVDCRDLTVRRRAVKLGGGMWEVTSDQRLKTDIQKYGEGLKELDQIQPVSFRYNGKEGLPTDKRYIGILAQELQKVAPHMVSEEEGEEENKYLKVDGGAFTYMLINAVKEQQASINALSEKVAKLEAYIAEHMKQALKRNSERLI